MSLHEEGKQLSLEWNIATWKKLLPNVQSLINIPQLKKLENLMMEHSMNQQPCHSF